MKKFTKKRKLNSKGVELLDLYETYKSETVKPAVKETIEKALLSSKCKVVTDAMKDDLSAGEFQDILLGTYLYQETDSFEDAKSFAEDILKDFDIKYIISTGGYRSDTLKIQHSIMARCSDMERIFNIPKYKAQEWFRTGVTETIVKNLYGKAINEHIKKDSTLLTSCVITHIVYDKDVSRNVEMATVSCDIRYDNLTEDALRSIAVFIKHLNDIRVEFKL